MSLTQPQLQPPPSMIEEVVTWPDPPEACRRLEISHVTLYGWLWAGKIRAFKICDRWRVDPVDIERLRAQRAVARQRRKPPASWREGMGVAKD
jgi:hypothetical protein